MRQTILKAEAQEKYDKELKEYKEEGLKWAEETIEETYEDGFNVYMKKNKISDKNTAFFLGEMKKVLIKTYEEDTDAPVKENPFAKAQPKKKAVSGDKKSSGKTKSEPWKTSKKDHNLQVKDRKNKTGTPTCSAIKMYPIGGVFGWADICGKNCSGYCKKHSDIDKRIFGTEDDPIVPDNWENFLFNSEYGDHNKKLFGQ